MTFNVGDRMIYILDNFYSHLDNLEPINWMTFNSLFDNI